MAPLISCGPHQSTTKVSQAAGCVEPRSIARYHNSSFVHEAAECFRAHLEIDRAVMHGMFGSRTVARFTVLALAVAGLAPSLPRHMARSGVSIGLEFARIFMMGGAIFVVCRPPRFERLGDRSRSVGICFISGVPWPPAVLAASSINCPPLHRCSVCNGVRHFASAQSHGTAQTTSLVATYKSDETAFMSSGTRALSRAAR